jgi:hypothetical protein
MLTLKHSVMLLNPIDFYENYSMARSLLQRDPYAQHTGVTTRKPRKLVAIIAASALLGLVSPAKAGVNAFVVNAPTLRVGGKTT